MGLALRSESEYTYGDYLEWTGDERWEIIEGVAYDMSPAPSTRHQEILGELHRQISNYLLDKTCKVYLAPFDVRLIEAGEKETDIRTVIQPDISIICDSSKIDEKGCLGAPDLIIEIISPSNLQKDLRVKLFTYEKFGVKEYWILHPVDKTLMVFELLPDGRYGRPDIYVGGGKVKTGILPDLIIDLATVFPGPGKP